MVSLRCICNFYGTARSIRCLRMSFVPPLQRSDRLLDKAIGDDRRSARGRVFRQAPGAFGARRNSVVYDVVGRRYTTRLRVRMQTYVEERALTAEIDLSALSRREVMAGAIGTAALAFAVPGLAHGPARMPNFLFIMADDLG